MQLAGFNEQLSRCPEEKLGTFVQKRVLHGTPFVFSNREDEYFEFRNKIALKFSISFHEVFIVGSGKLGFSYTKHRDSFDENSDIDVAIVSGKLFEEFSLIIRDYQYQLGSGTITLTSREKKKYRRFLEYYAKGWIRPDMSKSIINKHNLVEDWDEFFNSISYGKSEVGDYKVAAGVFKSYDYLQKYHYESLRSHRQALRAR